jgi:hypothetical protein
LLAKARGREFVAVFAATLRHDTEAVADLDALDGVEAHHRVGDVGVELVVQRLAQAHRHAVARTSMRAPQESPALRSASM